MNYFSQPTIKDLYRHRSSFKQSILPMFRVLKILKVSEICVGLASERLCTYCVHKYTYYILRYLSQYLSWPRRD